MLMNITSAGNTKLRVDDDCELLTISQVILTSNIYFNYIFFILLAGIISLLDEPIPELKMFALKKLDSIVDEFWPEISEVVEKM